MAYSRDLLKMARQQCGIMDTDGRLEFRHNSKSANC